MTNPNGYRGNRNLKSKGIQLEWSQERLQEYLKCARDPIYFAEQYIQIVHVDRGLIPIILYDYQKEIMEAIASNRRVTVNTSRQAGKCVCINTPIRLRNKHTGEVIEVAIGKFYESQKIDNQDDNI